MLITDVRNNHIMMQVFKKGESHFNLLLVYKKEIIGGVFETEQQKVFRVKESNTIDFYTRGKELLVVWFYNEWLVNEHADN